MGQGDVELLVPARALGVGDDPGACDCGLWDHHGNVRVAGDDARAATAAVVVVLTVFGGVVGGRFGDGGAGVAGGEAEAEAFGGDVHVG